MATPAQIKAQLEREEKEFRESPTAERDQPTESRGVLESLAMAPVEFARGVPRGIANLAPVAADVTDFARGRPSETGDRLRAAMQGGPGGLPDFLNRPDTFAGRLGERFGSGAPFMAAGGPGALIGKGAVRNIAADIAAAAAGQVVEDTGGGPATQFAAELATGFGAGSIGRFSPSKRTFTNKEVKSLADKLGVSEKAILRARNIIVESDIPIDPVTGKPDIDNVVSRLSRSVGDNPDPNFRPSTRQSASKVTDDGLVDTPAGIARRENTMARKDGQFGLRLEGRKNALMRQIESDIESLQPGGTFGQAQDAFVVSHDISDELVDSAWRNVDLDEVPSVSTSELKKAALKVQRKLRYNKEFIPPEVRTILEMPDEIPASDLQAFRSAALRGRRNKFRASQDSIQLTQAQEAGPIFRQLREEVENLPGEGSREYRAALQATRKHYDLFPADSRAVSAMNDINDGPKVVSRIINSNDPEGEARTLIRALEQTPRGADGFRQTVLDDLMNYGIDNRTAGSMISRLNKKDGFYKEVLGEAQYGRLLKTLRRLRTAKVGSAATAGAAEKTGSALNNVGGKIRGLTSFLSGGAGANEAAEVVRGIGNKIDDMMINKEVVREFMLDPESAIIILTAPDKKTLPVWKATADMILTRALTRRALASETAAAARSFIPDQGDFERSQAVTPAQAQQPQGVR